jgi:hypothetical protein
MITGTVNADFEPIISLSIRRADGEVFTQEAIVVQGSTVGCHCRQMRSLRTNPRLE